MNLLKKNYRGKQDETSNIRDTFSLAMNGDNLVSVIKKAEKR